MGHILVRMNFVGTEDCTNGMLFMLETLTGLSTVRAYRDQVGVAQLCTSYLNLNHYCERIGLWETQTTVWIWKIDATIWLTLSSDGLEFAWILLVTSWSSVSRFLRLHFGIQLIRLRSVSSQQWPIHLHLNVKNHHHHCRCRTLIYLEYHTNIL